MDSTERYLRTAADDFHQADMHLRDTERYLRKLLLRLEHISSPAPRTADSWNLDFSLKSLEEPVPAGS